MFTVLLKWLFQFQCLLCDMYSGRGAECGTAARLRTAQVAVVQFASEPRVELPLQAIETGAFQACVAELARPPPTIVPTWLQRLGTGLPGPLHVVRRM